jgi:DNA/RNA-binding domain of Phe-tRNA-synthetase-like protein
VSAREEPRLAAVAIDPRVVEEHPGLRLWTARIAGRTGRTPPELRERLRGLADRFRGAEAVAMRSRPVPWAYRVLFRHLGLDPDVTRTPVEALALERLLQGGFTAQGMPEDALALATLETGVPVWAFDADRVGDGLLLAPDERVRAAAARARAEPPHAHAAARGGPGARRRGPVRRGSRLDGGGRDP